jgi:hypothetical protein
MRLLAWVLGCSEGPEVFEGAATCDGLLQADDGGWIDAVFDRDGDGYFDAANPDCALAYGVNRLDCDDGDVSVSPAAPEEQCNGIDDDCNPDTPDVVDADEDGAPACEDCADDDPLRHPGGPDECWDQVDNNCDLVVDEGCGPDYNGRYALLEPIQYNCLVGTVRRNFSEVTLLWIPPFGSMRNAGGGQPGNMDGAVEDDGRFRFVAERDLSSGASCRETYTMLGRFDGTGSFEATFTAEYSGRFGACGNCQDREWDVTAIRVSDL